MFRQQTGVHTRLMMRVNRAIVDSLLCFAQYDFATYPNISASGGAGECGGPVEGASEFQMSRRAHPA